LKLVITGNPGAGKHTCSKIIAEKTGAEVIDINRVAIDNNAIAKKTERGLEVDVKKLAGCLPR
jgi:adenylate kinase